MKRKWQSADPLDYELLKANARNNRKSMTEAERAFWEIVKSRNLGEQCLRQHIIGDYIVDFLFRKSKLIIEIDGGYHFTSDQQKEDAIRTDWLENMGYTILRFTNEAIINDTDNIINSIKEKLIMR